ncbi:Nuclear protein Es2 family protein [Theileria parva strain Muguga]|uniref:Nuclear protein Es2 n=1 Tax=Theileria parva TaxID=5875 RepID=Q4N7N0_THEPA|nr:Nuclear protein Es2 family protein [Theileria parva strain Muguga]EAN34028.1 Nuclear protein Es2 family protein [Theileria parva strain Muguga]|eukprot:XP_766311.1 hypothetical protein [Theileria parva strain Muguga]
MESSEEDSDPPHPTKRSRRNLSELNPDTKGHSSSNISYNFSKHTSESISLYGKHEVRKHDKQSIVTLNKSLGIVNGVSTKVEQPLVPYRSTLARLEKRKKVKELNEDDYVACMENIIERDYFPDLLKYRYLKAISDAENAGNKRLARKLTRELEMIKSGKLDNNVYLKTLGEENIMVNLGRDGLKLDEFNRIFSSEDNRSFDRLMEKDIESKINKMKWIEDAEYKHNLAISDIQKKTNLGIRAHYTQHNKFEARNSLYFTPELSIPEQKPCEIMSQNTNLNIDEKEMERMKEMHTKKTEENKQRIADEKLSELLAAEGVSKNKELVKNSKYYSSYVFTPKIIAGEAEPIFTWGTISSIESIPPTPLVGSDDPNFSDDTVKNIIKSDKSLKDGKEFNMPKPLEREEIANKLYKKLKTPKTPMVPGTPFTPKTPLIVQRLIAKHTKNVDVQLRDAYSARKYKSSKASSIASHK